MNKDIEDAVNDFYRLKQDYERENENKRKKIKRDKTLSRQNKQQRLAQLVTKCVNCAKQGGTIFSTDKGVMRARCGATEPCSLNIEIKMPRVENLHELYSELSAYVQGLRTDIIRTKFDLLFGYITQEQALGTFNNTRDVLNSSQKYLDETKNTFNNIVHNKRNSVAIKVVEDQLFASKEQLRELAKQYDEDGSEQVIRDMVELYKSDIIQLTTRVRNLKYAYNAVECGNGGPVPCEDNVYHLIQNTYSAHELEMPETPGEKPIIIANVK